MTYFTIALFAALIGAAFSYPLIARKLKADFKAQLDEYSISLWDDFSRRYQSIEDQLEHEKSARVIAEVKLSAVSEHKMDPRDYVPKEDHEELTNEYLTLKASRDKLVSEQKSKEVRLGAIAETLAPFLDGFPYDPKRLRALGSPIDYIAFEDDCIVLIEIKSGESKLNKNQKSIKDIVERGDVRFETYRIDKDGVSED